MDMPRTHDWTPQSWTSRLAKQMPEYADRAALAQVEDRLSRLPPLIYAGEARTLRGALARVARGEGFVLQGGDCAESFSELSPNTIRDTFRLLLQMAVVLTFAGGQPVVKIGRIAGQFAKPRSSPTETRDGVTLPSYRGDIINGPAFTPEAREPDPQRMLEAYLQSAATLNLLRAFSQGGYADLHRVHEWGLEFVAGTAQAEKYRSIASEIGRALRFMAACGITGETVWQLRETDFYTSHEALLLPYEQALTRVDSVTGQTYGLSGHFLWLGERTRDPQGAHVEYLRGIQNPIGIKCGPNITGDDILALLDILDPGNEAGRITLISRMGAGIAGERLPPLLRRIKAEGRQIVWVCDPMHGNTVTAAGGLKTRAFDRILQEVREFFAAHAAEGTHPGGVHFELTSRNVTECTGGSEAITESQLAEHYETACDPRLNGLQALELAFILSEEVAGLKP